MNIEWMKNKAKEKFYPITHAKAVLFGGNNKTVNDELTTLAEDVTEIKNDLSEQFHNRSYSGTLPECVSSVTKAIANGQSTTFNFIRENDSYYFGFVGRFTENLIGGLMTNSSGAVYKIGGSVESPTTTQM